MTTRLLATTLATLTIAASAPFAAPAVAHAHADGPQRRHVHATPAGKIPALARTDTVRGPRVQGTSST